MQNAPTIEIERGDTCRWVTQMLNHEWKLTLNTNWTFAKMNNHIYSSAILTENLNSMIFHSSAVDL